MKFGSYLVISLQIIITTPKRIILMKVYAITFSFFVFDKSKDLQKQKTF